MIYISLTDETVQSRVCQFYYCRYSKKSCNVYCSIARLRREEFAWSKILLLIIFLLFSLVVSINPLGILGWVQKQILTNEHSQKKHPHQIEVARVEDVVSCGGNFIHHPEVGGQVEIPRGTGEVKTDCEKFYYYWIPYYFSAEQMISVDFQMVISTQNTPWIRNIARRLHEGGEWRRLLLLYEGDKFNR